MNVAEDRAPASPSAIAGLAQRAGDGDDMAALQAAAGRLGLELSTERLARLVDYLDLLERWNRVYNLTAVRERTAMRVQHLNDSLAIAAALRRGAPTTAPRVLDVGSGAGLPGLVVAACWPEAHVTCVDAVGKKAAFATQAAAVLGMSNAESVHARVESLATDRRFDLVTARAFATVADAIDKTRGLLAPGGTWALAKGRLPIGEIEKVPTAIEVFHVEPLSVPELDAERHLVWARVAAR